MARSEATSGRLLVIVLGGMREGEELSDKLKILILKRDVQYGSGLRSSLCFTFRRLISCSFLTSGTKRCSVAIWSSSSKSPSPPTTAARKSPPRDRHHLFPCDERENVVCYSGG